MTPEEAKMQEIRIARAKELEDFMREWQHIFASPDSTQHTKELALKNIAELKREYEAL